MINISYTISPFLSRYGEKLEQLRQGILITTLSPKIELSLQFEATIARINAAFLLLDQSIDKNDIKTILARAHFDQISQTKHNLPKKQNPVHSQIIRYKKALDYINQSWLVSNEKVTVSELIKLHDIASPGKLRVSKEQMQEVLDYLESTNDNPIIQAAIAKLVLHALEPFTEGNEAFSTLCAYLFLYRAGLDYRKLIVLESGWAKNMLVYKGQYKTALQKTNITSWIEYFVRSASQQLEEVYQNTTNAQKAHPKLSANSGWELNERQKTILHLFDDPTASITNRTIQKMFKISQITASRDLAKLTALGKLFSHGKGRSVRYTKV